MLDSQRCLTSRVSDEATNWRANHYKIALHDELFQAVKALRKHVEKRGKPGAGAPEQQRMRIAIAGSGLPPDNPLVLEAWGLLRQWEQEGSVYMENVLVQSRRVL
eukprot:g2348.t1